EEFARLGIQIKVLPDEMLITGGKPLSASVNAHNDHRIAMALAISAGRGNRITIHGCEAVGKSYPGFFDDLEKVGGIVE
ncbi:MAG: hypothetical protein U1C33_01335, partial [Candidatus Cloacimonadaceae bacterium]|nr:hypothetical protein [Candidatus Cloacimonadaceae bacterium]